MLFSQLTSSQHSNIAAWLVNVLSFHHHFCLTVLMVAIHVVLQRFLCLHFLLADVAAVVKRVWEVRALHMVQHIVLTAADLSTYFTLVLVLSIPLLVSYLFDVFQQNVPVISWNEEFSVLSTDARCLDVSQIII